MKLIIHYLLVGLFLTACSVSFGASTLQFSNPFGGKIAAGFSNAAGVPTNGMQWGIIVDTGGDGFDGSGVAYNPMGLGSTTNAFMSTGGLVTDDYFVSSGALTADSSLALENDFVTTGGNGTIGNMAVTYSNGIAPGQAFALIWFNSNSATEGDKYGFLNIGQLMPADNLPGIDMSAPFGGVDPFRSASNTFAAAGPIPEPSRVMLLGFGLAGLFFRRRR